MSQVNVYLTSVHDPRYLEVLEKPQPGLTVVSNQQGIGSFIRTLLAVSKFHPQAVVVGSTGAAASYVEREFLYLSRRTANPTTRKILTVQRELFVKDRDSRKWVYRSDSKAPLLIAQAENVHSQFIRAILESGRPVILHTHSLSQCAARWGYRVEPFQPLLFSA